MPRRVAFVLVVMFVVGTLAGTMCWAGQTLQYDTTTAQARAQRPLLDSLVRGPTMAWAKRLQLQGWTITVFADTLSDDIVAQTATRDEYKLAQITLDLRAASRWNFDKVIVHELWHVKLSPYTTLPRFALGTHGGLLALVMAREEERLVTELTAMTLAWATR